MSHIIRHIPAAEVDQTAQRTSTLPQHKALTLLGESKDSSNGMSETRNMDGHVANGSTNGVRTLRNGKRPFLIGVSGGTASGKSTVCKRIMEKLGIDNVAYMQRQVVCISQDSFYRELNEDEKVRALKGNFNFDHPDAFNNELLHQTLVDILHGQSCEIPVYDYCTHSSSGERFSTIYPADVVLVEGILVFYIPQIRNLFHMKLFVDTDSDLRLARRVLRDIKDRGRDLDHVLNQYTMYVKPAFEEFCLPTKKFADVIIPRGADNTVAIDLIVQHIRNILHGAVDDEDGGAGVTCHPPCNGNTHHKPTHKQSSLSSSSESLIR